MLIPVFVSSPTESNLNNGQESVRRLVAGELGRLGLAERTLGQTDYPTSFPLREVLTLAKHCSGGVILGFTQFEATAGTWKKGTPFKSTVSKTRPVAFPTQWNQLEAGILFALAVPLLVFRDHGITGGVFDPGATDLFIHEMPKANVKYTERKALRAVFQRWAAQVRSHYYGDR